MGLLSGGRNGVGVHILCLTDVGESWSGEMCWSASSSFLGQLKSFSFPAVTIQAGLIVHVRGGAVLLTLVSIPNSANPMVAWVFPFSVQGSF